MPSRISNFFIKLILSSPLYRLLGESFAVIRVTGWRTGRFYTTSINIQKQADGWLAISLRSRTWWRNLKNGQKADLLLSGQHMSVHGEVIEGREQVILGLKDYFKHYPGYAKYFQVPVNPAGDVDPSELKKIAAQRVLIHLSRQ